MAQPRPLCAIIFARGLCTDLHTMTALRRLGAVVVVGARHVPTASTLCEHLNTNLHIYLAHFIHSRMQAAVSFNSLTRAQPSLAGGGRTLLGWEYKQVSTSIHEFIHVKN